MKGYWPDGSERGRRYDESHDSWSKWFALAFLTIDSGDLGLNVGLGLEYGDRAGNGACVELNKLLRDGSRSPFVVLGLISGRADSSPKDLSGGGMLYGPRLCCSDKESGSGRGAFQLLRSSRCSGNEVGYIRPLFNSPSLKELILIWSCVKDRSNIEVIAGGCAYICDIGPEFTENG